MPIKDKAAKAAYQREYHARRKDDPKYRADRKRVVKKRVKAMRQWCNELKAERGCAHCGEKDPRCLVFHHLSDKSHAIGTIIDSHKSWTVLKAEVEKCVVLCANCHAKEHIS